MNDLQRLHLDEKGQLDLFGNVIDVVKTQPWIMAVFFLGLVYATTVATFSVFGVDIGVFVRSFLNSVFGFLGGAIGVTLQWELLVIIMFFFVPVSFILGYGYLKK